MGGSRGVHKDILNPLKTIFFCMSQVSDSWVSHEPIREMCRCKRQIFAGQVWVAKHSRGTCETLYLKFLKNGNFLRISQLETTHEGNHDFQSRNGQKQSFSTLKIWHFEKNFKDQSGKNHFQKHMKYSKIFLGLIIKQLNIHKSHLNA